MAAPGARTRDRLRTFALALPGAWEDFPWGDRVVKVDKKIFVFLGLDEPPDAHGIGVKLVESHEQALAVPGASPSGYGLGKAGWVSIPLGDNDPPVDVAEDWVEESYRLVAPKRLTAE